ncbi:EF-hand domain-containing protein [Kitasatospora cheerisanensis]|uniref:Calcium-binding protein n=1 Tax=Kitasatospora cheerisanensis KCTC 2395 TaxID=1348663 RepID=A0A066Z6W9_9ACTN|nr:EF-hand domain-containing protein [Kitasatospora cheerisanensis]KDN87989.1 calcium-binding protein [Kitasatospora cheerisanensis KCTC 2395]
MPVKVKNQKFTMLFDWFDQGGDGVLTHDDFRAMGELFAALAAEDDRENTTAMREAFEEWWRVLLEHGDANGDGRIDRQEFLDVMAANVTAPEHFEKAVLAIADALMRALDTNRDGVLSKDEYVRMYDALGIPPVHSEDAFRRLDRDGTG